HPFEPGDIFVFYSDGITEARNSSGEFFGEYRLYECVRSFADLPVEGLIDQIRAAVVAFSQREIFEDDLTCVVVRINTAAAASGVMRESRVFSSDLRELARIRQ